MRQRSEVLRALSFFCISQAMATTSLEFTCTAPSYVSHLQLQQSPPCQFKTTPLKLPTWPTALKEDSKIHLHTLGGVRRGGAAAAVTGRSPGCCSGGNGIGSGGCGSHSTSSSDLANVGREFEAMVAASTLQEFEKEYNSAEMRGTITRDILKEVMNTCVEKSTTSEGEKFLNVEALLDEARGLSKGDFVFEVDMDDIIV